MRKVNQIMLKAVIGQIIMIYLYSLITLTGEKWLRN